MRIGCCLVLGCLLGLAGCSEKVLEGPPVIKYGQDECGVCGMILNDERCASAMLVDKDGARKYMLFDDAGEQLDYARKNPTGIVKQFVHDFSTREWIDADRAHFVRSESIHTPMGSGVVAFKDRSQAEIKAREVGSEVLGWDAVQKVAGSE